MSRKEAIKKNLREVSKHSKNRCENCMWFLSNKQLDNGKCENWDIDVNSAQLCDAWSTGYSGKYDENLIREYQQQSGFSTTYATHPKPFIPYPTAEDYDSHYIERYFVRYRSRNTNPIIEVSETFSKKVSDNFYDMISLKWKIAGPEKTIKKSGYIIDKGIADANRDTVKLKDKNFVGLKEYLTDYTELAYSKVDKKSIDYRSIRKPKKKSVYGSGIKKPQPQ